MRDGSQLVLVVREEKLKETAAELAAAVPTAVTGFSEERKDAFRQYVKEQRVVRAPAQVESFAAWLARH
jgi:hypothetical protein